MLPLIALLVQPSFAANTSFYDPKLMKKIDECQTVSEPSAKTVYLVKQWHLDPTINTKDQAKKLPQAANQIQIYDQLMEWKSSETIDTVVAEGCEGTDLDSSFKPAFNGWDFQALKAKSKDASYRQILTHPVLKFEAKQPNAVHALCGDNLSEVKKSQVALSDARGDVGYLSRLSEYVDQPEKAKTYLEGTIEALKLKPNTTISEAIKALALDLKATLNRFSEATHERNLSFSRKIAQAKTSKPVALVIGGLHANDLKQVFENKKMNCVILEPLAYKNDEEALNQTLQKMIDHLNSRD